MNNSSETVEGIAIIGMSGRFPGARNLTEFWKNLRDGVESITFFGREEARAAGVNGTDLNDPNYILAGGILEDVDLFDPGFFGFNPKDAENMDPQQRFFLECAYEALEDAGYARDNYPYPVGVYAGANMSTYFLYHLFGRIGIKDDFAMAIGNDKDYLATRLSYILNLKGPSISVQSACSTSMVAVATACEGLWNYQCDLAIAGGAAVKLPLKMGYLYQEGMISSPDGHTRPFDTAARGTVFTSAVGVVILKRLEDALKDGDHIYAVIKGIAVNNDGSTKVGFTAPSREGQAEVIAAAQNLAGVNVEEISYIETHGTGTALGDPIEVSALTQVFQESTTRKNFCAISSVKGNIGHAVSAAGVAGLIKTALALKNREIPPSINFDSPNPKINFVESPFYVNTRLTPWKEDCRPCLAGVSSFGFGGTNVHAVLEEAPIRKPQTGPRPWHLLTLSARSAGALDCLTRKLADHFRNNPGLNLADAAYTLHIGRKEFEYRRALVAPDLGQTSELLAANREGTVFSGKPESEVAPVFLFSAGEFRLVDQVLELYQTEAVFREAVGQCAVLLQNFLGIDLIGFLGSWKDYQNRGMDLLAARAMVFAMEYATARLWISWGVKPQALIGKNHGEFLVACLSGVLSLEDALMLVTSDADSLKEKVGKLKIGTPKIPYISGVTGDWISNLELMDQHYWTKIERSEMFTEGLRLLAWSPGRVFLQIGDNPPYEEVSSSKVFVSFDRKATESSGLQSMLTTLGRFWLAGVKVDWKAFHQNEKRLRIPLPTYPFERQRYWVEQWKFPGSLPQEKSVAGQSSNPDEWLYYPSWKRTVQLWFAEDKLDRGAPWLLFLDRTGLGERIGQFLKEAGLKVITVTGGGRFGKLDPSTFTINPDSKEDYRLLIKDLFNTTERPQTILHLWSVTPEMIEESRLEFGVKCLENGFYSLLFLAQTLEEEAVTERIRLGIVSNNMHSIADELYSHPEKAPLLGPAKVIAREFPNITCQSIDITLPVAEKAEGARLVAAILAEITTERPEFLVALRGAYRWVPAFERFKAPDQGDISGWIREGGTYLITGGLGGLGLIFAQSLAKKAKVNLVLTRRSPFPKQEEWEDWLAAHDAGDPDSMKIKQLREVVKSGTAVLTAAVDITNQAGMRDLVERIRESFGPIAGVIHAAGIADNSLIRDKSKESAAKVLAPKVTGTLVLEEILKDQKPDFMVLFSSSSAILGNIGFVDYAAANAFLDTYAGSRQKTGVFTVAINWDEWEEVGMAADNEYKDRVKNRIPNGAGLDLFDKIMSLRLSPQIVVSPGDFIQMLADIESFLRGGMAGNALRPPARTGVNNRPEMATVYRTPSNQTEESIAEIWQGVLGVAPVGVDDNFFDLGGHSLLATTLVAELGKVFPKKISLSTIFERPTVAQLAGLLGSGFQGLDNSEVEYEEGEV